MRGTEEPAERGGGPIDIVGHRECDLVINDEGRINGSPVNLRITHWILNDSMLAKEGRAYEWSVLYGDVVVTGPPDLKGDLTEVDPALVNYFSSLQLSRNAVDDWTTREVGLDGDDWNLDRPSTDRQPEINQGGWRRPVHLPFRHESIASTPLWWSNLTFSDAAPQAEKLNDGPQGRTRGSMGAVVLAAKKQMT